MRSVVLCLDGCSMEYIKNADMPNLKNIMKNGTSTVAKAIIPSVTNVNNISIITGEFPSEHGIIGNYYFDKNKKTEEYMESPSFLECKTLFEKTRKKVAALTTKDKLKNILSRGTDISFSAENPPLWIKEKIGNPPEIYSAEVSAWLIDASLEVLNKFKPDIVYISTTDFIPHMFGPETEEAKNYMNLIDQKIGLLLKEDINLGITADHGMNKKTLKINLETLLLEKGMNPDLFKIILLIKDKYVRHHGNLGGSAYIYSGNIDSIKSILHQIKGVEYCLTKKEAIKKFHLHERIGDLLVLGSREVVFGLSGNNIYENINIRSHGSLHEAEVPFILNKEINLSKKIYNKDIFKYLSTLQKN